MKIDRTPRPASFAFKATLFGLAAVVASVAVLALKTSAPDYAASSPVAHAAVLSAPAPILKGVSQEEPWMADESSHGLRPDAAH
jgi:hypothetical protein